MLALLNVIAGTSSFDTILNRRIFGVASRWSVGASSPSRPCIWANSLIPQSRKTKGLATPVLPGSAREPPWGGFAQVQVCRCAVARRRVATRMLTDGPAVSVVYYAAPWPRVHKKASEDWTTAHQPLWMDLPEPGVPEIPRDPNWYQSLKDDLAGPGPGGFTEQIQMHMKRAARNLRMPPGTFGKNNGVRLLGASAIAIMGEHAELYSDDVDRAVEEHAPHLSGALSLQPRPVIPAR